MRLLASLRSAALTAASAALVLGKNGIAGRGWVGVKRNAPCAVRHYALLGRAADTRRPHCRCSPVTMPTRLRNIPMPEKPSASACAAALQTRLLTTANAVHARHGPWSRTGDVSTKPPVSAGTRASNFGGLVAYMRAPASSLLFAEHREVAFALHALRALLCVEREGWQARDGGVEQPWTSCDSLPARCAPGEGRAATGCTPLTGAAAVWLPLCPEQHVTLYTPTPLKHLVANSPGATDA